MWLKWFPTGMNFWPWVMFRLDRLPCAFFSFEKVEPDFNFWKGKLDRALDVRKKLGLVDNDQTNVYRLVHGEGDGLPGLIVDFTTEPL